MDFGKDILEKLRTHQFLFEELVKRDFKQKYKRTILGVFWSVLSPLLMLSVLAAIFGNFFGKGIPHYVIYVFSGQVILSYFLEATNEGMYSLTSNAHIFSKINVPKYIFLFSKNVSSLINFGIILLIYFSFVALDGISFTWKFFCLIYPIVCLIFINLGIGLIVSALFIFFKDIQYLYRFFTQILSYGSAVFYSINNLSSNMQMLFYCNPVFVCISYFRSIVINNAIPDLWVHGLLALYSFGLFGLGYVVYKRFNYTFIYYI